MRLYSEACPASTGIARIGVFEGEPTVIESVLPIDLHSDQVYLVGLIHDTGNTFNTEMTVVIFRMIEPEDIGHAGTTTALHSDPELLCGVKPFRDHEFSHLRDSAFC